MKKFLSSFSLWMLVLIPSWLCAQSAVEITFEEYNIDMDGISLIVGNGANGLPAEPQTGENINWDYSIYTGENEINVHQWVDVPICFMGETRRANQDFPAIGNQAEWLYSFEETGIKALGFHQIGAFIFLGNGGGLLWKDTCEIFPDDQYWIPFPLNYQDAWERDITEVRPFSIEIPDVFEASDGEIVRRTVVVDSVSAWGTISIPGPSGPLSFEALLVEQVLFQQDSLFLEGLPANDTLLTLFNFVQGRTNLSRVYTWRSKENEVLFVLGTSFFGNHLYHAYLSDPALINAVPEPMLKEELLVYPNPVSGESFTIEGKCLAEESLQIRLWNSLGQLYITKNLAPGLSQTISLPQNRMPGLYWLEVISEDGRKRSRKALVVE